MPFARRPALSESAQDSISARANSIIPRNCHPERSPARFCLPLDLEGRGTQFEGSAFSVGAASAYLLLNPLPVLVPAALMQNELA